MPWHLPHAIPGHTLAVFTRQLAVMYRAGVPLPRALEALAQQAEDDGLAFLVLGLGWHISKGRALSEALRIAPRTFSRLYIALVEQGEALGTLERSLDQAATFLEADHALRSHVRNALTYPLMALLCGTVSGGLALGLMVPLLSDLGGSGPAALILETLASTLRAPWTPWLGLLVLGLVTVLAVRLRAVVGPAMVHVPVVGPVMRALILSRIARTLGAGMDAGLPLLKTLQLCADVADHPSYRTDLLAVRKQLIQGGASIGFAFSRRRMLYGALFVDMLAAGDRSSTLPRLCVKLADMLDEQVETSVQAMLSVVEPLLILGTGLCVGAVALLAFLSLSSTLSAVIP